jgi:DNA topoisomerase-1
MNLIIVESPTKAKTLSGFLGKGYKVVSSFGHIRDLPAKELGVDVENDFKPKYVVPPKAKRTISAIKKEVPGTKQTILATDEDREGEAIAWHLAEVLGLKNPNRIVFHEITKSAVEEALKNPRKIDMALVDSQQARRILDRIVGYKLSPFLWKKVARGLSAGRVQSVAVRLVAEREEEIRNFAPQEYWSIIASLKIKNNEFNAILIKKDEKTIDKLEIKNKEEADKIVKDLKGAEYIVEKIERKETKKNPLPPFITSTLQQEAWKRFRFPAKLTMQLSQQLYEKGYITYHRTDSVNLSNLALAAAKKFIEKNYGKKYWPGFSRKYKTKNRAQEAHEAIRPTSLDRTSEEIQKEIDQRQYKIYDIIYRRFVACQMAQASFDSSLCDIKAGSYTFRANGQILKFDGFLKIYPMKFEEADLPELEKNEILDLLKLNLNQHFTQPPSRYNEATLIKELEKNGIGRPSTYAAILSTVQERNYIEKDEQRKFRPTEIGITVNSILIKHFPEVVDITFTAQMENDLDKIAEKEKEWTEVCKEFYSPFSKNLEKKYKEVSKKDITGKETKKICPKCGSPLVERLGRFGRFYACSKFPKCRYTESLQENKLNIKCPKCQKGNITEKRSKRGKIFYGCDRFPDCDFALWDKPTGEKCSKCGSLLVEKRKKIVCSNKDCENSKFVAE